MNGPAPERALLAVAAVLVATPCGQASSESGKQSPTTSGSLPTVEQVYATAAHSLAKGEVYHEKIVTTQEAGEYTGTSTTERWTDAAHDRAREQTRMTLASDPSDSSLQTVLTVGPERWLGPGEIVPAPTCHGADAVASEVIGCPGPTTKAGPTSLAWATLDGRRVLSLSARAHAEAEDSVTDTTDVVYLDPATMLPVGARSDGTMNEGADPVHLRTTVVGTFVTASSLPQGFFDPASLGWKKAEPLASLPTKGRVYWLGQRWSPGGGLPDLVLGKVEPGEDEGYDGILDYDLASDRYGAPGLITIQVWRRAVWDSQHIDVTEDSCGAEPAKVLAGSATFYCAERGQVDALVTLPDAVLFVGAPLRQDGDEVIANPFGTVAAMTKVLQALRAK